MYEIVRYLAPDGKVVVSAWLEKLRDTKARLAIDRRIVRMELGNLGDHRFCRDGVWEMRIDFGAGYRVYYALAGARVILLLCGGDKRTQDADIDRACKYWSDWQRKAKL
ncbi:MAG: type II toxin-antitoxin system RelE/ParE family toxin [Terracidiphilus sp.]